MHRNSKNLRLKILNLNRTDGVEKSTRYAASINKER